VTGRFERRALACVLVAAAGLRVAWLLHGVRMPHGFIGGDPLAYLAHGEQIARGHGYHQLYVDRHLPTAFYPPGWPLLLGAAFWVRLHTPLPGSFPMVAAVLNAAMGVGTVALAWFVGRRVFGSRAGLLAAALVAAWPNLVILTAAAHVETACAFSALAATAAALVALDAEGRSRAAWAAGAGLLLGAAVLIRPVAVVLIPALGLGWWARRQALRTVAVIALVGCIVLAPAFVRNAVRLRAYMLSTNVGDTLCIGHWEHATGGVDFDSPACALQPQPGVRRDLAEGRRNRHLAGEAIAWAARHPAAEVRLVGSRARHAYVVQGDDSALLGLEQGSETRLLRGWHRRAFTLAANAWFWVVVVAAASGSVLAWRRPAGRAVAIVAAGLASTPMILYGDHRFVLPALPVLAVLAGGTGAETIGRLHPGEGFERR
jgi:hypothetical protein